MNLTEAMARKSRPFLMRGKPHVTAPRPTVLDPPDPRVPPPEKAPLTPEQLRALQRPTALDPRIRAVDRLLCRWGASVYTSSSGSPGGNWPDLAQVDLRPTTRSGPTALGDDEFNEIEHAVLHLDEWARSFVFQRYRLGWTIEDIAIKANLRVRAIFEEQRYVLFTCLGLFHGLGIHVPTWEPDA